MLDKLKEFKDKVLFFASENKVWLMVVGGAFMVGFVWGAIVA
jgi:hypothetical protein